MNQQLCPLCRDRIEGTPAVACPGCGTRCHQACAQELRVRSCPVLGCGAPLERPADGPQQAPARPDAAAPVAEHPPRAVGWLRIDEHLPGKRFVLRVRPPHGDLGAGLAGLALGGVGFVALLSQAPQAGGDLLLPLLGALMIVAFSLYLLVLPLWDRRRVVLERGVGLEVRRSLTQRLKRIAWDDLLRVEVRCYRNTVRAKGAPPRIVWAVWLEGERRGGGDALDVLCSTGDENAAAETREALLALLAGLAPSAPPTASSRDV